MEHALFAARFHAASAQSMEGARGIVLDELPERLLFLMKPNSGSVGSFPLRDDQKYFPEDSLPEGRGYMPPVDADSAIEFLFRGGFVPEWINVSVNATDGLHTYIFMRCSTRFTSGDELYHIYQGMPPFRIGGTTTIPIEWEREITRLGSAAVRTEDLLSKFGKFRLRRWQGYHENNDPWRIISAPFEPRSS